MRKFNRLGLAVGLAFALAGCGASPEQLFDAARADFAKHEFTRARVTLGQVLQDQPANAPALDLLVRTHLELADADSALAGLDRLAALGKSPSDGAVLRGEAELLRGNFDTALAMVARESSAAALRVRALARVARNEGDAAREAFAEGARAPGRRGRLLADHAHFELAQGNLGEAKRLADLAARERPRPLSSYLASADVAAADSRLGAALAIFDAALGDYPQGQAALLGKIRILDALGRTSEARPLVVRALGQNPGDPDPVHLNAKLDARDGNWPKVREALQASEHILDARPEANVLYAKALMEVGQPEQARARLASQVLRTPGNRPARLLLGQTKLAMGDAAGAAETLRPLSGLGDATAEELGTLARALRSAGDPGADVVARQARQAAANGLMSALTTADKAMRGRDWPTAIQRYEAILAQTTGDNVLVLNNLAHAYSQTGNHTRALALAERALKLAPDNASVMDTAGWVLHRSGQDRQRALALLRAAARKAPGNGAIAGHLKAAERG